MQVGLQKSDLSFASLLAFSFYSAWSVYEGLEVEFIDSACGMGNLR